MACHRRTERNEQCRIGARDRGFPLSGKPLFQGDNTGSNSVGDAKNFNPSRTPRAVIGGPMMMVCAPNVSAPVWLFQLYRSLARTDI